MGLLRILSMIHSAFLGHTPLNGISSHAGTICAGGGAGHM